MKIALTALILTLGFQAHAEVSKKEIKGLHLLNYAEFVKLNRDDRASYIEELRLAAIQAENADLKALSKEASAASFWIASLIAQAHAAAGDMCIYAGYVSRRDSQNHCVAPAGSSGSCGAGQTQCNPLLYGYGPSSGGICTSSRSTPTNDCERQYQKIPNYKAYQVADQLVGKDMKSQFDAQAAQLNTYCSSPGSTDQKGLCDKLKAKTQYMKAKIAASEQRKKSPVKNPEDEKAKLKAADVRSDAEQDAADNAKEVAKPKEAAPAVVKAPTLPAAASVPSSRGADGAPATAAAAPTAAPAAEAPPPPPVAPKVKEPEQKAEVKKTNVTPGECLRNKDDFDAKKDSLPADFQGLATAPLYYTARTSQVTSSMQFRIVPGTGKFKMTSAVWPPSFISPWTSEDDIESICPSKTPGMFLVKIASGTIKVTVGNGKLNAENAKGQSLDYTKASNTLYNATTKEVIGTGKAGIWINNRNTGQTAK